MSGGGDQDDGFVVKLRGLPWSATVDEILRFFKECNVKGGKNGVHMTTSREGRPSGEAFVEFENEGDMERACERDRDHMGNRYIEGKVFLFFCTQQYTDTNTSTFHSFQSWSCRNGMGD